MKLLPTEPRCMAPTTFASSPAYATLPAQEPLCLAHVRNSLEWCEKYRTCQRHTAIVTGDFGEDSSVMARVCKPGKHDQYIEVVK